MKISFLKPRGTDKKGASLVEFGLLVGLISVVAISAVFQTGNRIKDNFSSAKAGVANGIEQAIASEVSSAPPVRFMEFDLVVGSPTNNSFYGASGAEGAIINMVKNTAPLRLVSFYYYVSTDRTYLYFQNRTADSIQPGAVMSCDGTDVPLDFVGTVSHFYGDPFNLQGSALLSCRFEP